MFFVLVIIGMILVVVRMGRRVNELRSKEEDIYRKAYQKWLERHDETDGRDDR